VTEAHFAVGVVKKINLSQVQSGNKMFDFWISVKVINVQERKNRDFEQELEDAKDGGFLVCHPLIFKGLESRRECFEQHLPSMLSAQSTNQDKLLCALMAREFKTDFDDEESNASAVSDLKIVFGTSRMAEDMVATSLTDASVLIFDQATQCSFTELAHLICRLPNLEKFW